MHIQIPFNCKALVELPEYGEKELTLPSGSYDYTYQPIRDFRKPYHAGTTLKRLSADSKAMEILEKYVPAYAGIAASGDLEMGANSLIELSFNDFIPCDREQLRIAMKEIEELVVTIE